MAISARSIALLGLLALTLSSPRADEWPQWRGPKRDGVWREDGIVKSLPKELPIRWRRPIGAGYTGPSIASGRLYVTDRILETGVKNPDDPFKKQPLKGGERILCLDTKTGATIWAHEYPCVYKVMYPVGPRATPTVADGKVYSLGTMGDLICLDAAKGTVVWSKDLLKEFKAEINTWGYSTAPLVDGNKVIVLAGGRPGACVVALEKDTGKELWRALDVPDWGYSAPEIFEAGGKRQLVVWTPKSLSSLDPETGKAFWEEPFPLNNGLSVASPVLDVRERRLFVSAFYNGTLAMSLAADKPEAKVLWRGKSSSEQETDGLHAMICTPVEKDGYLYGVCSYGQLRCLEASTGKRVWETLAATGSGRWWNAFIVRHEDRFFIANEQGDLIIARLTPEGYREESRSHLIDALQPIQRRKVVWSHPAFADRCVYARNDAEILCAELSAR